MKVAEAVVIGGGVIGCSVLYHLASEGIKGILLEADELSSGTSGKCDGNIQIGDSAPGFDSDFVRLGQSMFNTIGRELGCDVGYRQEASLMVFESSEELEEGGRFVQEQKKNGLAIRFLDSRQVHECEPELADDILGGFLVESDGRVNPMLLTFGLAGRAQNLGSCVMEHSRVQSIEKDRRQDVFRIKTRDEEYVTPIVVNAAGAGAARVGDMVGIHIPIVPRQGQILVSEVTDPLVHRTVTEFGYLMTKFSKKSYRRNVTEDIERFGVAMVVEPTEAGNFLVGSSRAFVGDAVRSDYRIMRALASRAMRFFPKLKNIHIIRSYSGLRPFTDDHRAIISETGEKGFYIAAGHEGGGITQSLVTGRLMTEIILGKTPCIHAEPLRLDRFGKSERMSAPRKGRIV